jgi:hypothetical protein
VEVVEVRRGNRQAIFPEPAEKKTRRRIPMKKFLLSAIALIALVGAVTPAQAQHRHRHCFYRHHHRVCRYY